MKNACNTFFWLFIAICIIRFVHFAISVASTGKKCLQHLFLAIYSIFFYKIRKSVASTEKNACNTFFTVYSLKCVTVASVASIFLQKIKIFEVSKMQLLQNGYKKQQKCCFLYFYKNFACNTYNTILFFSYLQP